MKVPGFWIAPFRVDARAIGWGCNSGEKVQVGRVPSRSHGYNCSIPGQEAMDHLQLLANRAELPLPLATTYHQNALLGEPRQPRASLASPLWMEADSHTRPAPLPLFSSMAVPSPGRPLGTRPESRRVALRHDASTHGGLHLVSWGGPRSAARNDPVARLSPGRPQTNQGRHRPPASPTYEVVASPPFMAGLPFARRGRGREVPAKPLLGLSRGAPADSVARTRCCSGYEARRRAQQPVRGCCGRLRPAPAASNGPGP